MFRMPLEINVILITDDDYDVASLIEVSLHKIGLAASSFTDPLLALEKFRADYVNYDLVISDVRMPAMNGYEFVKQIKR
jgi:two-component system CheB/CheR fusion protein